MRVGDGGVSVVAVVRHKVNGQIVSDFGLQVIDALYAAVPDHMKASTRTPSLSEIENKHRAISHFNDLGFVDDNPRLRRNAETRPDGTPLRGESVADWFRRAKLYA